MSSKTLLTILSLIFAFSFFASNAILTQAQTNDYTVLAPLPGTTKGTCNPNVPDSCKADIKSYIEGLFKLIIGLAAVIAVAYIIYGGIRYITTDAIQDKQEGKTMITNAIYGLILVIISWLILYTINPRILKFDLNIGALSVPDRFAQAVNPCANTGSQSCRIEQQTAQRLRDAGITPNQPCTSSSCPTQVANLQDNTISQLTALRSACNCSLVITGGSEQANRSNDSQHLAGTAVDLRPSAELNRALGVTSPVPGQTYNVNINGRSATALYEVTGTSAGGSTSTGNHWHINFQ